jgi:phosphoribosylformylglycinamidine synthase
VAPKPQEGSLTDPMKDSLIDRLVSICREMHQHLGGGLPPDLYEEILCSELSAAGIPYERARVAQVRYKNFTAQYPIGLVVDGRLIVRINPADAGSPHLEAAMRHSGVDKALLLNFSAEGIKHGLALPGGASTPTPSLTSAELGAEITPELIVRHGLSSEEFAEIVRILGRQPNITELGIFSVMWSEHCSYKNTRRELRKFPTTGERVLVKAGEENAGVLDIGDGWAVAFKIESHNHPSAIEPFQGAATGVGGILRDIFTMGARPIFLMNSLRFGEITGPGENVAANRALLRGVVHGIGHYGNCIGIPTIGGEIAFDASYDGNPLVNVMCVGVLRHEQIARGAATGVGNPVYYVGAETGRDGLAGAAFASRDLTEDSRQDRPAVQVGDPFRGKLLLEACLELLATGAVAGIQDMGAAGLTCSTCETASRGGTGVEIDLEQVPQREPGMTPYEIMLSESQERMLIIAHAGQEHHVEAIFQKWELPFAKIGHVMDDGLMRVRQGGTVAAEIPARALAEDAPVYEREVSTRPLPDPIDPSRLPEADIAAALPLLLAHPTIASKRWVYEQYDHMVGTGTVVLPGSDAAVFHIKAADKYIAATTDCNALYCAGNPREGACIAVAEAARNLACSGAAPLGLTDNLNFGNPYRPANFWDLRECVEGIAEACRGWGIPVTGGNVSLYNESPGGVVDPTPVVGMVGLIEKAAHVTTQAFKAAGDVVFLIGEPGDEMGCSHYLKVVHELNKHGPPPRLDFDRERAVQAATLGLIRSGLVRSAHDCSEGGLAVALAECCFGPDQTFGFRGDLGGEQGQRPDVSLFNESQSRVLISVTCSNADAVASLLEWRGVPHKRLGEVTLDPTLSLRVGSGTFGWPTEELRRAWEDALPQAMNAKV